MLWQGASIQLESTGTVPLPGPGEVLDQAGKLFTEHRAERRHPGPDAPGVSGNHSDAPTFPEQIAISLATVMAGFGLAALIAIPLGVALGLCTLLHRILDPLIQLLRPISPLAWLPLVSIAVSATLADAESSVAPSFIIALLTVLLCCLWPMLINTATGVSNIEADWLNVSKVLRLDIVTHLRRIVIPAAVPAIFTGLRLSLSIAWMVLVAAEMLAQSPGLGKFIWDEFQSGTPHAFARILVAVFTIGLIGLVLDRLMLAGQRALSWGPGAAAH